MTPVRLRFTFSAEAVSAVATLLWEDAPQTCQAVTNGLPFEGRAKHGIFSGAEVFLVIPPTVQVEPENASSRVLPGDLAYYSFPGGVIHGWPDPVSEILWFYDRYARPSMPDGPVAVNLFGRFEDGWEDFAEVCRAMQTEGGKPLLVETED